MSGEEREASKRAGGTANSAPGGVAGLGKQQDVATGPGYSGSEGGGSSSSSSSRLDCFKAGPQAAASRQLFIRWHGLIFGSSLFFVLLLFFVSFFPSSVVLSRVHH